MRAEMRAVVGLIAAFTLFTAASARADMFVTPFVGATFGGDAPAPEPMYGIALGGMLGGLFGVEGEFAYTPNFFATTGSGTSSHVMTLTGNLLVGAPVGAFRPYATAGVGLIRQQVNLGIPGLLSNLSSNDFGLDAGGGTRVLFTDHLGVRADIRYFKVRTSGGLGFWRGYGGVSLEW